jgi:tetratricopeptide (TPR) repeat protein
VISDNPWIRQIAIAPLRDDLEVRFDTRPGVLVDTEEKRQGEAFYWLVRLKKSLVAASDAVPAAQVGLTRRSAEKPDVQAPLSAPRDKGLGVASAQSAVSASNQPASVDAQRQPATRVKPVRLQISQVDAPDRTRDQLRQALDTIKQGDSVGGIELLDQLLGSDIDRDVRIHKLRVYQRLNQVVAFNRLLNESLRLYPADPVFGLYRANSLFAAQRYADLVQQFADEQEQYELVSLVATSQQRLGQHDAAVEGFKRTLEVNPAQPRFWISLAISQQHLGQTRQALGSYQMALRSGPLTQKLRAFAVEKIRQLSD